MFILSTNSLNSWECSEIFATAKKSGFSGLEVVINKDKNTFSEKHLNSLRDFHSLPIYSLHTPFCGHISGWSIFEDERITRIEQLAKQVGAGLVVLHPPIRFIRYEIINIFTDITVNWLSGNQKRYKNWLENNFKEYQKTTSIIFGIENMPYCSILGIKTAPYNFNSAEEMLKEFDNIVFDVTHTARSNMGLLEAYEKMKGKIVHVHLSNYNGKEHTLLTDGILPIKEFLRQLKKDGYNRAITLEFNPKNIGANNKDLAYRNLSENLAYAQKYFS